METKQCQICLLPKPITAFKKAGKRNAQGAKQRSKICRSCSKNTRIGQLRWTYEQINILETWWPHFGTIYLAEMLTLKKSQVKAKVDHLCLKLLPKNNRLCSCCRNQHQFSRYAGTFCKDCHLEKRKENRSKARDLTQWIAEAVSSARYRAKTTFDITTEYMVELWERQRGRCHYSGIELQTPTYGSGRNLYGPSIDRIRPEKGYTKGNVVWASFICNIGKSDLPVDDYIKICRAVVDYQAKQL